MATVEQRRQFASDTIQDAKYLLDVMRRIEARGERWNALSLSEQAFEQSDFDGIGGLAHLTPAILTSVIVTFGAALAAIDINHMGNLERAIP